MFLPRCGSVTRDFGFRDLGCSKISRRNSRCTSLAVSFALIITKRRQQPAGSAFTARRYGPCRQRLPREMTVLAVNLGNRAREVAVPGKGAAVGAHECVPGVCTVSHYFANVFVCRMTGAQSVCCEQVVVGKCVAAPAMERLLEGHPGSCYTRACHSMRDWARGVRLIQLLSTDLPGGLSHLRTCNRLLRSAGCHHVCDRTCRYRQLAEGGTSCRLSGKFFLWEEQSILGKAQR